LLRQNAQSSLLLNKIKNRTPDNSGWCGFLRKLLGLAIGLLTETLFELSDASTGIKNALLTGVERMALVANFNID